MGAWAVVTAVSLDRPLIDPEGSFLGPSWLRLPLLLGGALLLDLLPRTVWVSKGKPAQMPAIFRERWRTHWTRERLTLVGVGIVCFYVIYVCYRNLKSFLPEVNPAMYDRELHMLDRVLFFGHEPGPVLHEVLGTFFTAHFLSTIYLWFIPLVAILVTVWLVWSRNISFGWWFVTSQGIIWALGTVTYYLLPTIGPGLEYPFLYTDLTRTGTTDLMISLVNARQGVRWGTGEAQGVAGFASLHTGVTLLWALMIQYTVRNKALRIIAWVNFAVTVVATIYFGWHYVADVAGGIVIALVAFWVGGLATGQRFERGGLRPNVVTSAPSSAVPASSSH
nr:phosphatase PAP2 family protein [Nocardioides sp. zg-DK7169]